MRLTASLVLVLALLLALAGTAQAANNIQFGARGEVLPLSKITTFQSEAGETKEAFVLRVARWMRTYTDSSSFEACGPLMAADGGGWAVPVFTNLAQMGCAMPPVEMDGFAQSDETIHSHPNAHAIEPNARDLVFLRGQSRRFDGTKRHRHSTNPNEFSATDYAGGPGYLVTGTQLLHQRGKGTSRIVAEIPPPAPSP